MQSHLLSITAGSHKNEGAKLKKTTNTAISAVLTQTAPNLSVQKLDGSP